VGEFEMGGEREYEYEFTGGLGHPIVDSKFSVGLETRLAWADVAGDRGNYSRNFRLGPSIQFRPLPRMTVNVAALGGLTEESDDAQMFVNTGWEF
jgi:hypothetical protein